jgi:hypothetical protein
LLLVFALIHPSRAVAEQADAATRSWTRKLATEAVEELERGDAESASAKLEKAYAAMRVPSLGLWSARALARRGLLVEASERYLETTRLTATEGSAAVHEAARKDAERELDELAPRIPSLRIDVEGALENEVRATLDGAPIASASLGEERPVNPGSHRITGELAGQRQERSITLNESDKKRIVLEFRASRPALAASGGAPAVANVAPPRAEDSGPGTRRTAGYVALGAGGLGLVAGGVTGFMALGKKQSLDDNDHCRDGKCLESEEDEVETLRTLRTVSTVSFIAGGALAATGIVLLIGTSSAAPESGATGTVEVAILPRGVAVGGRF